MKHYEYSMVRGLLLVKKGEEHSVKSDLKALMGCNNRATFSRKLHRYRDIPHHLYEEVNRIFESRGIEEKDVWVITEV